MYTYVGDYKTNTCTQITDFRKHGVTIVLNQDSV